MCQTIIECASLVHQNEGVEPFMCVQVFVYCILGNIGPIKLSVFTEVFSFKDVMNRGF